MRQLLFTNLITLTIIAGFFGLMCGEKLIDPSPVSHEAPVPLPALRGTDNPVAETSSPAPLHLRIRFLTNGDFPPFTYRNDAGRLAGYDLDLARALCAHLAARCNFTTMRWRDLVPSLKRGEGEAIVSSMLIPARGGSGVPKDAGLIYSRAYYSTPGHFATRRKGGVTAVDAASLSGKRVAVQAGSVYEAFLKARFARAIIVRVDTVEAAENALLRGRADLFFADRNTLLYRIAKGKGAHCCRMVGGDYADPAFFGTGAGIVFRKGDEKLRDLVNQGLDALAADGTQARIGTQYLGQSIR